MWLADQINLFRDTFLELYPSLLEGLFVTLNVTFLSLIGVFFLGFISCLMQMSKYKVLKWISLIYVYCIRGTPFIVQLYLVFFGIPQMVQLCGYDMKIDAFSASIITCAVNGGAYMTEVFRTSIQSVDYGQKEAALSLGISSFHTMKSVILPQAFRSSISSIGNQLIITFKDTSICSAIALGDIVYRGKLYIGRTMMPFVTYMVIGVFYILIITSMSLLINLAERKLNYATKD